MKMKSWRQSRGRPMLWKRASSCRDLRAPPGLLLHNPLRLDEGPSPGQKGGLAGRATYHGACRRHEERTNKAVDLGLMTTPCPGV